jgi:NAD(P)-dependent dehydrogenase (short-subunit alcohol dehydrogenase family)
MKLNHLSTNSLDSSGGLGYHTVAGLGLRGAKVYVAGRSQARCEKAIEELHREHPGIKPGHLSWLPLDLLDVAGVLDAARVLKEKEERLDILGTGCPPPYDS